ncbi:hypothetical protein [Microtetraspora fusca]|uniref:hypothetical protein n=1 Tax=Microtetraspora fusca TaxID=1997 RepID=UPI00082C9A18|nr:hypothetical protein [Microtetraspora fusca]
MDLPLSGERLSEIVLFGDGKAADVMVELCDGRQFTLPLGGALRVVGCPGLKTEVTRWDDRSLVIRYFGEGLAVAAARIEVPDWTDEPEEAFHSAVHKWLATPGFQELPYALEIEIEVTPARL